GLAYLLDGGEEQPEQNGDDRNHHQQLDERKAPPARPGVRQHVPRAAEIANASEAKTANAGASRATQAERFQPRRGTRGKLRGVGVKVRAVHGGVPGASSRWSVGSAGVSALRAGRASRKKGKLRTGSFPADFGLEPGAGERPVSVGGGRRDAQNGGRL